MGNVSDESCRGNQNTHFVFSNCLKKKENAEALVAATREIGLEVSADKTKYMVMSRDQNAGRITV
jgi:hypothetical protein